MTYFVFTDIETAQAALDTVNGYRLQGKVLVIEFARERRQAKTEDSPENPRIKESTAQKDLRSWETRQDTLLYGDNHRCGGGVIRLDVKSFLSSNSNFPNLTFLIY